ncbi:MAG: ScaI family restriction endonuclease [Phycisphaerae bacterium]|nr:ScaI family restriction endonuclease [Phycisphaerae bacterium]MCC7171510.1 ScaI family restriction endonuclease [Planctomycetota bacterium]
MVQTRARLQAHPLKAKEIVEVVLKAWEDIFASSFGSKGFRIGKDIVPKPQIMGFFLHELIPLELAARYPNVWRPEKSAADKDVNHISDPQFSIEIKTSSHATAIFGNRSYAQAPTDGGVRKSKSGYYLAVNFQKFVASGTRPMIARIRFGWLDHTDWVGQAAATGQQAHLTREAEAFKLLELFPKNQVEL